MTDGYSALPFNVGSKGRPDSGSRQSPRPRTTQQLRRNITKKHKSKVLNRNASPRELIDKVDRLEEELRQSRSGIETMLQDLKEKVDLISTPQRSRQPSRIGPSISDEEYENVEKEIKNIVQRKR